MTNVRGYQPDAHAKSFPKIICGMFQIKDREVVRNVIDHALGYGYRSFDTAAVYKNEAFIGDVLPSLLQKYHLTREDVFITTKLGPKDLASESAINALDMSLRNLKLDYVDLFLIHWPGKQGLKQTDVLNKQCRHNAWLALEKVHKSSNKIRHLGVSNYTLRHLTEMKSYATKLPDVVQNEFHPDFQDEDVLKFCHDHEIHFQAYSPLGSSKLVNDKRFDCFSCKYGKSIEQVLLKWSLQKGCSIIPKTVSPNHLKENFDIFNNFVLDEEDVIAISKLGKQLKYCWNPENVL